MVAVQGSHHHFRVTQSVSAGVCSSFARSAAMSGIQMIAEHMIQVSRSLNLNLLVVQTELITC